MKLIRVGEATGETTARCRHNEAMRYDPDKPTRIEPTTESGMLGLIHAMVEWKKRTMEREQSCILVSDLYVGPMVPNKFMKAPTEQCNT